MPVIQRQSVDPAKSMYFGQR